MYKSGMWHVVAVPPTRTTGGSDSCQAECWLHGIGCRTTGNDELKSMSIHTSRSESRRKSSIAI
jgi:hypothetical protein